MRLCPRMSLGASTRLSLLIRSVTSWWHFKQDDSTKRVGSMGKSHMWLNSHPCLSVQSSRVLKVLGLCEASLKLVPLPWPEWHEVQPNFSAGCLLFEPTKRSSRGWPQNSVTRDG